MTISAPVTRSAKKQRVEIQWVMRTKAEWRGTEEETARSEAEAGAKAVSGIGEWYHEGGGKREGGGFGGEPGAAVGGEQIFIDCIEFFCWSFGCGANRVPRIQRYGCKRDEGVQGWGRLPHRRGQ